MENADEILFDSLRSVDVALPENVSLSNVSAEFFVAAVARCVNCISEAAGEGGDGAGGAEGGGGGEGGDGKKIKEKLPKGLAARHRQCTALGSAVKAMGFNGDTSFNTFLYPNENDARRMLLFLAERLPKEDEEEEQDVDGADVLLNRSINNALRHWNKDPVYQLDDEYFNARPGKVRRGRGGLFG
jgi:hypothetical protein